MDTTNTTATVTCQGRTWQLNKETLTSKSTFFAAALCNQFSEAGTATVNLPSDDPKMVAHLLRWIQSNTYQNLPLVSSDPEDTETDEDDLTTLLSKIRFAIDIFAAAVKFGVKSLQEKNAEEVRDAFNVVWRDDLDVPEDEYWAMVREVYASVPSDESVHALRHHFLVITCNQYGWPMRQRSREFRDLWKDCRELREDLRSHCCVESWDCAECVQGGIVLIKRCECGCVEDVCARERCLERYVAESFCWECGARGTMAPEDCRGEGWSTCRYDFEDELAQILEDQLQIGYAGIAEEGDSEV